MKQYDIWVNASLVDNTGRAKSLAVGLQDFEANRAGLLLHKDSKTHVVFSMGDEPSKQFEIDPNAARQLALHILDLCNGLGK